MSANDDDRAQRLGALDARIAALEAGQADYRAVLAAIRALSAGIAAVADELRQIRAVLESSPPQPSASTSA